MTIEELQQEFLTSNKGQIAPEDFFILLAHATKKETVFLLAHPEYDLTTADETLARNFFRRRQEHEPVAIIIGHKEFYGYDFRVTKDTLIPRPETELLVELALNKIKNYESLRSQSSDGQAGIRNQGKIVLIDVGTGSGNIIISIASELRKSHSQFLILDSLFSLYATDISKEALAIAKENARINNTDQTITFLPGDLLAPCLPYIREVREIIIAANLPYLSDEIYQTSDEDIKKFEPQSALVSTQAGLSHYYRLFNQAKNLPKPITLFLEINPEQTLAIKEHITLLFPKAAITIHKDLAQKKRIVEVHIR